MKTKRGRAAVLRRPNWGKAAALPYQLTGLWGQERNLGLHEPAVLQIALRLVVASFFRVFRGMIISTRVRCAQMRGEARFGIATGGQFNKLVPNDYCQLQ